MNVELEERNMARDDLLKYFNAVANSRRTKHERVVDWCLERLTWENVVMGILILVWVWAILVYFFVG